MSPLVFTIVMIVLALFAGLAAGRFLRGGYPRITVSDTGCEIQNGPFSTTAFSWSDLKFAQILGRRILLQHDKELIVFNRSTKGVPEIIRMVQEKNCPVLFESLLAEEDRSWAQTNMTREEMVTMRDMLVAKLGISGDLAASIAGLNAMDRNGK